MPSITSGYSVGVAWASTFSMSSAVCSTPNLENTWCRVYRRTCSKGVRSPPMKVSTMLSIKYSRSHIDPKWDALRPWPVALRNVAKAPKNVAGKSIRVPYMSKVRARTGSMRLCSVKLVLH